MGNLYKKIALIHAFDDSTAFLKDFNKLAPDGYIKVGPETESIEAALKIVQGIEPSALIVFLGHGYSSGLYCPDVGAFGKRVMVNDVVGNKLFSNHDVVLLSCNSGEFIKHLNTYRAVIGFGNIISSLEEISSEAEYSGQFRNVEKDDIDYFNRSYVEAIMKSINLLINDKITFKTLPKWIAYFINKQVNYILRLKHKSNRMEVAKLFFEFRDEIIYKGF